MSRQQGLDALEASHRPRQSEEREDVIDAAHIRPRFHHTRGEQRLDFRRKEQPVALPRPEEWTDAKAIAAEEEALPPLVPEREGELPAEAVEHSLFGLLPQVRNHFRIAMRREAMAASFQFRPQLRVFEQLAVENDVDALVFVRDRLPAVGYANDAEP